MKAFAVILLALIVSSKCLVERIPDLSTGVPAGLLPYCPGVEKNSTFTEKTLKLLQITIHHVTANGIDKTVRYPIENIMPHILLDHEFDLQNKKTLIYAIGYIDDSVTPDNFEIARQYAKMGYNVLVTDTLSILTRHYPKAVRLTRAIGLKLGELLVKLVENGLELKNMELMGSSLGAHIASFAAKHLLAVTGQKPYKLTGLDPAGPCFRNQKPETVFYKSDAELVSAIHTNIDGFGMERALGQVDFYINGGEYQPGNEISLTCLLICSHTKVLKYYIEMLKQPKLFIGMKCDSVQDARFAKCYGSTVLNYAGPLTDFSKPGIYYVPTKIPVPYGIGEAGLVPENEPFERYLTDVNAEDVYVI